jgi:hypothetical protein
MINKKKRMLISFAAIVIILGVAMSSSSFMLRLAVFSYSPSSAFTMKYEQVKSDSKGAKIYRIIENAPIEKGTRGELTTWAVYSIGPFHYARYHGEA